MSFPHKHHACHAHAVSRGKRGDACFSEEEPGGPQRLADTARPGSSPSGTRVQEPRAPKIRERPPENGRFRTAFDVVRMGTSCTKAATTESLDASTVARLKELDQNLFHALSSGAIKLLDASFLRSPSTARVARRQDLETVERESGRRIFVSSDEAIAFLASGTRSIAALTYSWAAVDDPDPSSTYLCAVRRFLCSPLGLHVRAVFWDYASLSQPPRTAAEDELCREALSGMGDIYASPLGTTVMRHQAVPPRPTSFDGLVLVTGHEGLSASDLHSALSASGVVLSAEFELVPERRWVVRFASHAEALAAVEAIPAQLEGAECCCAYNERRYGDRGWPNFESAVSTEALSRLEFLPELKAALDLLPPKLVEIDAASPVAVHSAVDLSEGVGPRIERARAAISASAFTGRGDKAVIMQLYNDYIVGVAKSVRRTRTHTPTLGGRNGCRRIPTSHAPQRHQRGGRGGHGRRLRGRVERRWRIGGVWRVQKRYDV